MAHLYLAASAVLAVILVAAGWRFWLFPRSPVPIAVLSGDWRRRCRVRRQLAAGLRRLVRVAGAPDLAILVVDGLPGGQRAACSPVRRRADGRTVHLVSLALSVAERRLTADEVLAALAEQCLALALGPKPRTARTPAGPASAADQVDALLRNLGAARDGRGQPKGAAHSLPAAAGLGPPAAKPMYKRSEGKGEAAHVHAYRPSDHLARPRAAR